MQNISAKVYLFLIFIVNSNSIALAESSGFNGYVDGFFTKINNFWGAVLFWDDHPLKLPLILIIMVGAGLFFTWRYNFVNISLFKHAFDVLRGKFDKKEDKGEITHFQALTSALSATVGLGNIAGVAIAISLGGPGAVFWLWVIAFFGMSLKFSSCSLAQMYRRIDSRGKVLGGPMVYLEDGIKEQKPKIAKFGKGLAVLFALFTIVASYGGGNLFQGNQSFELVASQFPFLADYSLLFGIVLATFIGIVIIGGIRRIGEVTGKLVPFMCLLYCCSCLAIILMNFELVPGLLGNIFYQAFNPDAMWAGGFIGVLTQGVRRASFSNEAGLGSAAIAHAAAKTDQPVREGVVAMIGPFIDTHVVCTMTSLAILITGAHLNPELAGKGAAITSQAFASLGSYMPLLLTFAALIFAYSTVIAWAYYGEQATQYLFGIKSVKYYRISYVMMAAIGPVMTLKAVIDFSDLMLLSMAFPNILGMIFLSGKLKDKLLVYRQEFLGGRADEKYESASQKQSMLEGA